MQISQNKYEAAFRDFVEAFGGEVLPQVPGFKSADYLFRKHNVVAELKCLMEDQTASMNQKLTVIMQDWYKRHRRFPEGVTISGKIAYLSFKDAPKEIQDKWMQILKNPLSDLIAEANRQIRATVQRESLTAAKGLVLIFNAGNVLHNRPEDYKVLLVDVLRKLTKPQERRFPYVHAAVYFSFDTVKSRDQNMNFWAAVQVHNPGEDTTSMDAFLREFQQGWYAHIEKTTGRIVRNHRA